MSKPMEDLQSHQEQLDEALHEITMRVWHREISADEGREEWIELLQDYTEVKSQ